MSVWARSVLVVDDEDDAAPGTPILTLPVAGALLTGGSGPVVGALLSRLGSEHPVLSGLPGWERLLPAAWRGSYRSARTRRAYAGDIAAWLDWLREIGVDALHARRVHVDLWVRQLLDAGAAASSTSRRLSALTSFLSPPRRARPDRRQPGPAVRRPPVDPDHTATVGLDRDQALSRASRSGSGSGVPVRRRR